MKFIPKKFLSLLIICSIFILTGCAKRQSTDTLSKIQQRGRIIVGVKYDTMPFGYKDSNGNLVGYDIDLAHYIAKELLGNKNAVEFKPVTAANRILALNSNQVDMVIATMTITQQRKEIVDFSSPYFYSGQAILVPRSSKITSLRQLNDKKVIIIFGSTAEKNLMMYAPDAKMMGYKTYTSGYEALKEGRADAITSDDTILLSLALKDKNMKLLPRRYSKEPYAIAFKKGSESTNLENKVNFIIDNLRQTGKLKVLKNKWILY